MRPFDEAHRLRARDDALTADLGRTLPAPAPGLASTIARTVEVDAYPTAPRRFFACLPVAILGEEVEGASGILSLGTAPFFALNLGGSVPPKGTDVVATFIGNRWVFRYDA